MATTLRERRRQMLRDEILQATQMLMAEKGHEAMSMDELASQVGISKPTLYSYFGTKDELIVQAAVRAMQRVLVVIEEDHHNQTPLQRLVLILKTILQFQIGENPNLEPRPWRSELFNFLSAQEESRAMMDRIDAGIVALVRAAIAQGEIRPGLDEATVTRTFFILFLSLKENMCSSAGVPDPATLPDTLSSIFAHGVRAYHDTG
jgi:AcrR family transcriptional regulator